MVSCVAWCRLMRFWRHRAEVVGWVGVGASLVVLSRGDGATGIFDWAFVVELLRLPDQVAAGVRGKLDHPRFADVGGVETLRGSGAFCHWGACGRGTRPVAKGSRPLRGALSCVAWCRLMRFGRQKAELVGRVGVGASPVVLLAGDRLGLPSRWEGAPTPLRRDVVAAVGSGTRNRRRRRLLQHAPLPCSWRARRQSSSPAARGRQAQPGLLPSDNAWAQR